ncbi:hypothetical protein IB277_07180 [Ensifer sp. ENS07]|uniref:hypothetical protein n=1 Tax=Ensifer sp. ENS07 TaxID=2769274 RepID=UPI00177D3916|nr:hypothetical protein [Ensifer sp. ENS07]MBD9636075.1 hypothetical protein [Ensifer sp. ENS07]
MGRMSIIPGTAAISIPGAPKITMSDWERQIASIAGLRHVIDPAKLDADGNGRDRFSGATITSKNGAAATKIDTDAGFNNLPVIQLTENTGGLHLAPGTVTASCSFICVASIAAAARATTTSKNLLAAFDGAGVFQQSFRSASAGSLFFYGKNGDSVSNGISAANSPPADVAAVYGFSFDAETKQSAVLWQNAEVLNLVTHTLSPDITADLRWTYGGSASSFGWIGKLGMALIFDRAMHLPTMLPSFQSAVSLLKQHYALS